MNGNQTTAPVFPPLLVLAENRLPPVTLDVKLVFNCLYLQGFEPSTHPDPLAPPTPSGDGVTSAQRLCLVFIVQHHFLSQRAVPSVVAERILGKLLPILVNSS